MNCIKYTIVNTGSTTISVNYMRCDDSMWQYNVEVYPGEIRNIWFDENTFSQTGFNNELVIQDFGVFPPITPTPTPSSVPGSSPTPTPTVTPTPSATPAVPLDPAALGALWWVDFTDSSAISQDGSHIIAAKNKITDTFEFSGATVLNNPLYLESGYTFGDSYSGAAQSYVTGLTNLKGTYSAVTQFTFSFFCNWFDDVQFGGTFLSSLHGTTDYSGNTQIGDWGIFNMPGSPEPGTIAMSFIGDLEAIADIVIEDQWNFLTIRHRHPGSTAILEGFNENTLVGTASNEIPDYTQVDPIFELLFGGGNIRATEIVFFDRAISDSELANLNEYIRQKYS